MEKQTADCHEEARHPAFLRCINSHQKKRLTASSPSDDLKRNRQATDSRCAEDDYSYASKLRYR